MAWGPLAFSPPLRPLCDLANGLAALLSHPDQRETLTAATAGALAALGTLLGIRVHPLGPTRAGPGRAGAAREALRCRAYRWSSGTRPRTKLSVGASCCEGLSPPSAIPGADSLHTASVSVQSIREHFGSRTADTQNRPAIDRQPSMTV